MGLATVVSMVINFPRTFIHTRKLWKFLFNWYYIILKTRLLQSSLRSIFRAIIFWDFKSRSLSEIFTSSWQDNLFSWSHVFTIKPVDNLPDFSKSAHATRSLNMKIVFVLSGHILIYSQTKDWELHFSIKKKRMDDPVIHRNYLFLLKIFVTFATDSQ